MTSSLKFANHFIALAVPIFATNSIIATNSSEPHQSPLAISPQLFNSKQKTAP